MQGNIRFRLGGIMNDVEFLKIYDTIKGFCLNPKTKDCEIDYLIKDKLLSVGYRTNDKYICKDYENVSISNVKKILSWIKKDKLKIIELMIKWC